MKMLRGIPTRYRFAAVVCGGISIFLFGVTAKLIEQDYRIAVNPRVFGHIERTWIITRTGKYSSQPVRVADLIFTSIVTGKPIDCRVEGLDIGSETFEAKDGDTIELSPIPGSCERPYVINIQPPNWVYLTLIGIVAVTGFLFALFAWAVLSDTGSRLSLSLRRVVDRRSGA
jgi:hypothetical protein